MENKKYVIGHKNPDTDSICSAIAYARLKSILTKEEFVPRRAGEVNKETAYVLKTFGVEEPELLENVHLQVSDLSIRKIEGVKGNESMREVWLRMKEENVKTLPVLRGKRIEGIVSIGDIAESYMEVYDNHMLSTSRTPYRNILYILDGVMLTGNDHGLFVNGKVVVAASDMEHMRRVVEKDDMVILGNRLELQRCAIEQNASCLIICQDEPVEPEICRLAREKEITVIHTRHGVFHASRNIHQSIPVRCLMTRREELVGFEPEDYVEDIKETMTRVKYRDFPVIDEKGDFVGFISRRRLLANRKKQVILVDHNEKSQAVEGIEDAEVLEIIDHHRLGNMETTGPIYFRNQPVGCTATIVYQMYLENHVELTKEIAGLLCSAILSDTLLFRSPTCTPMDQMAAQVLAGIAGIEMESHGKQMFKEGSNLKGKTAEEICYQDYKVFHADEHTFGVGQISFMDEKEIQDVKEELQAYLDVARQKQNLNYVFIMLTNILEEASEILYCGERADAILKGAFGVEEREGMICVPGMVSRKKQMIPSLVNYLNEK